MPLVTEKSAVLDVYAAAAERGWVIPAFGTENLTTSEAVLAAAADHARKIGCPDLPVTLAVTNLYPGRRQSVNYTHTRSWEIGLKLFLAELAVLSASGSPFGGLNVMVHLDHIQHDLDAELLDWSMDSFSSIMFDASKLPMDENAEATRRFVERRGREVVIEGACDEIAEAAGEESNALATPERVEEYFDRTGVDMVVANLGTEHRASAAGLKYHGELARAISAHVGPRLVLHGCSSVPAGELGSLFADGVCKVNIWTMLERDSSPALLADMLRHASRVAGPGAAGRLAGEGLLGERAELTGGPDLDFFTTAYRQGIVFETMKRTVAGLLALWYR